MHALILSLLLACTPAGAAPAEAAPVHGPPTASHLQRLARALELDEAQLRALGEARSRREREAAPLRLELERLRHELSAELASDEPDPKRVHALVDRRMEVQAKLAHLRTDGLLELHATLTPSQRARLLELRRQRPGTRHRGRRGRPSQP